MKISEIMKEMRYNNYAIRNEKPFKNMSILLDNRKERERCVFISDAKYLKKLDDSVGMVLTTEDLADKICEKGYGVCIVSDPRLAFYQIHNFLSAKNYYRRADFKTKIGNSCRIASTAVVPDKNISIGNNVIIEDYVTLSGHVKIGDNTIIHRGTVIGAEGNDFKRYGDKLVRTAQVGGILIGEGVEVDANCCIERPTFPYEDTIIGKEVKIGALSYISHGVCTGKFCQIKGMVTIAGYTSIGDEVFIGPGAIITNLVRIGNNVHITIGSVVGQDVKSGSHVTGYFAVDHNLFMMNQLNILRQRR